MKKLVTIRDEKGNIVEIRDYDISPMFVKKYGKEGAFLHYKNFIDENECWNDYDNKGNCIHTKDSEGYEQWIDHDDNGNVIHIKDSEGCEEWWKYDKNGNCTHYKHSDGLEYTYEYSYE